MVVLLGVFTKPKDDLYAVEGNISILHEDEMYYHVGIFIWSLNLIGIILGEFVNRKLGKLRNEIEETELSFHMRPPREDPFQTGTKMEEKNDHLDTLSRVQISSLLENNNRLVANGLAWSYYFGYLKIILPKLHERIAESEWKDKLSSNKLFILMPRDCWAFGKLSDEAEDGKIQLVEDGVIEFEAERAGISKRSYRNNVYEIKIDGCEPLQVLAQYATPLCSMYDMSHSAEANLSVEDRDEQAKLFVRTLEAILRNPSVPEVRNKYDMKENSSLDSLDGIDLRRLVIILLILLPSNPVPREVRNICKDLDKNHGLDTLSRVHISSLMENNHRLANGLAWSYYFDYLKIILPELRKRIAESEWKDKLSSNKLFILMPRDCWAYGKLSEEAEDGKIELAEGGEIGFDVTRAGIDKRVYRNNVYKITVDDCEPLQVLAEYATPLCSMYDMSSSAEANLSVEDRDEEAKLFVRTLEAILRNPGVPEVRNRYDMKENSSLDSLDGI
ncbi:stimulator of interferon genes -like, partial [Paramuricea clavata]